MITLISANWLLFLIALLIGVATAYWAWARRGQDGDASDRFDGNDGLLEKAGDAVPPAEASVMEPVAAAAVAAAPKSKPPSSPRPRKKPVAATATTASPPPVGKPKITEAAGSPDNLRLIKGIGPKLNALLNRLGVSRFDQIAAWKAADIKEVDQYLESFSGRITRDGWIDQAKFLAKDDIAGFEKKYGKL